MRAYERLRVRAVRTLQQRSHALVRRRHEVWCGGGVHVHGPARYIRMQCERWKAGGRAWRGAAASLGTRTDAA